MASDTPLTRVSYLSTLAAHLGERYSAHTRRAFLQQGHHFLTSCGVKAVYSREEVLAFVDDLIRQGYKADSIRTILTGVRAMFDVNRLAWPLAERDTRLGLPQETPTRPTLSPREVGLLIGAVRDSPGFPRAVVALVSVWGLRGDEVARAFAAGCDGRRLEVQTAKGGRKREHTVPSFLAPALRFSPTRVSTRLLHDQFEKLMRARVREPLPREGWHAVRRAVVTGLFGAKVERHEIHHWMGWKEKEDIALDYYHPDEAELDRRIYRVHPFLPFWVPRESRSTTVSP